MGEWWCRGKTDADKQAHSDDCVKKVWMRHSEPECTVARCTNTPPASFEPVPADVAAQKAAKAAVEETPVAPETQACAQTPPPPPATQTPRAKVLPPGWSEAWDETTSQKYYYGGLGETSWDIPTNPATLPPDWKLAPIQPGINKKVYYRALTIKTQEGRNLLGPPSNVALAPAESRRQPNVRCTLTNARCRSCCHSSSTPARGSTAEICTETVSYALILLMYRVRY